MPVGVGISPEEPCRLEKRARRSHPCTFSAQGDILLLELLLVADIGALINTVPQKQVQKKNGNLMNSFS